MMTAKQKWVLAVVVVVVALALLYCFGSVRVQLGTLGFCWGMWC